MLATVPEGELNFVVVDPAIVSFAEGDTVSFNITSPYGNYTLSGDVTLTNEDPSSPWLDPQYFDEPALIWSASTFIKEGSYTSERFAVCVMADGSNRFYSIKWFNMGHDEGAWHPNGPTTFAIPQEIHKIPAEYLDISSVYHITFSKELDAVSCDKSSADIVAAVQAGKTIVAHYDLYTTTSIFVEVGRDYLHAFDASFVSVSGLPLGEFTLLGQRFSYSDRSDTWSYISGTAQLTAH